MFLIPRVAARTQAAALRKRRALQRQVLYTRPVLPRVGEQVTVAYNPDATVLRWASFLGFPCADASDLLRPVCREAGTKQMRYCRCFTNLCATPHADEPRASLQYIDLSL